MAKSVSCQTVYERLAQAGQDGVPLEPKQMLKRWKLDASCAGLMATIDALVKGHRAKVYTKSDGGGKLQTYLRAVTAPV